MNANWFAQVAKKIVDKDWQAGDMIHVWVSDDDVAHRALLRFGERNANAARVNRYAIIDDEASKALRGAGAAL